MDRRHFFKAILFAPVLGPLLARFKPADPFSRLYLITDFPQSYLPLLLRELQTAGLICGRHFSFLQSSPFEEELIHSLVQTGWKPAPPFSRPDFSLSLNRLDHHVDPSFALAKEGKICDLRRRNLASLWMQMKRSQGSSSLLTVVSLNSSLPRLGGRFISVYQNGYKIDTLDLGKNIQKSFFPTRGRIIVKIKDYKAKVIDSSCRQKICCFSPSISLAGERIICAPNHFLLEVQRTASVDTSIG